MRNLKTFETFEEDGDDKFFTLEPGSRNKEIEENPFDYTEEDIINILDIYDDPLIEGANTFRRIDKPGFFSKMFNIPKKWYKAMNDERERKRLDAKTMVEFEEYVKGIDTVDNRMKAHFKEISVNPDGTTRWNYIMHSKPRPMTWVRISLAYIREAGYLPSFVLIWSPEAEDLYGDQLNTRWQYCYPEDQNISESFDYDWGWGEYGTIDDMMKPGTGKEEKAEVKNSKHKTLDDLYKIGADAMSKGADQFADREDEYETWKKLSDSSPVDMINDLKKLGTKESMEIIEEIEEVRERIVNFPD